MVYTLFSCQSSTFFAAAIGMMFFTGFIAGGLVTWGRYRFQLDKLDDYWSDHCDSLNELIAEARQDLSVAQDEVARLSRWERRTCPECGKFLGASHKCSRPEVPAGFPDPATFEKKTIVVHEPAGVGIDVGGGEIVDALIRVYYDRVQVGRGASKRWEWRKRGESKKTEP